MQPTCTQASQAKGLVLIQTCLQQRDEAVERAPVVEVHARALGPVAVGAEVLADVGVRPPALVTDV